MVIMLFNFAMRCLILKDAQVLLKGFFIDLGIIASIVSSYENIAIDSKICFVGEVGLSGEIRAVNRIEQRLSEAEKLGFTTIYLSKFNKLPKNTAIKIIQVGKIEEVLSYLFG